ncbi:uncharacterized protein F5891DRAFT_1026948 [Suillus fuscotomentosus]|uniref:Uncharacterized protein n=1 Tax=Suillus fuscotomentosus TaxID=1912939 RepID=A0AAD4HMG3_9AGAM|nr:uncharacterized protein F5891DRAFT_1026948 [Suillus fuscotomentosus]KAG1902023.1 hypothetical protein F5891DRAFT_1026948 [Suillus fuscotomentosus]
MLMYRQAQISCYHSTKWWSPRLANCSATSEHRRPLELGHHFLFIFDVSLMIYATVIQTALWCRCSLESGRQAFLRRLYSFFGQFRSNIRSYRSPIPYRQDIFPAEPKVPTFCPLTTIILPTIFIPAFQIARHPSRHLPYQLTDLRVIKHFR